MLGERNGNTKREHCMRCNEVVTFILDHKDNSWKCPNCDLD